MASLCFSFYENIFIKQSIFVQQLLQINIIASQLLKKYLTITAQQLISFNSYLISLNFSSPLTSTKLTIILLAKTTCLIKSQFLPISSHFLAETMVITEWSSALILISSSNQNCLIDEAGSARPFVSTTMLRTSVLFIIYSTAAIRSFLSQTELYLALQQMQPLGSSKKLLKGVPLQSIIMGCSIPISPSANQFWMIAYFSFVSLISSFRINVVFPEPKKPTNRQILAVLSIEQLICYNKILMIKGKYKPVEVIKDSGYKLIQKCVKQDGSVLFLKSYSEEEKRLIQNEIQTYQKLKQPHLHGFPEIKEAFEQNGRTYLAIEELGQNIQNLRHRCGGRFTLKTVVMIALQIIDRIEYLHRSQIIHGDIKPSNFIVGKGKMKHKIYLTDFQLSVPYIKNGKHVLQEFKDKFNGSLRFSSRAANSKLTLCRRDDLESLIYSLIFMIKAELPWMKITSNTMIGANEQLLSLKNNCRQQLLSGLPDIFAQGMNYIDQLKFLSSPDYDKLRGLFTGLMKKNGYELDYKYDWEYL